MKIYKIKTIKNELFFFKTKEVGDILFLAFEISDKLNISRAFNQMYYQIKTDYNNFKTFYFVERDSRLTNLIIIFIKKLGYNIDVIKAYDKIMIKLK